MLVTTSTDHFPSSFLILVVANQYKKDRKLFEKTARHWANVYANGPTSEPECDAAISSLVDMGFDPVSSSTYSLIGYLSFFSVSRKKLVQPYPPCIGIRAMLWKVYVKVKPNCSINLSVFSFHQ